MLRSERDLKMHVKNLGNTLEIGNGKLPIIFDVLRNLTSNLTANIFGTKNDTDNCE